MNSVNWGDVPAWAGAFLTSSSLILAFYILLRDRRTNERSQVERIGVWATAPPLELIQSRNEGSGDADAQLPVESTLTVFARNESSLPATILLAMVVFAYTPKTIPVRSQGAISLKDSANLATIGLVPPGETKKVEHKIGLPPGMQIWTVLRVDTRICDNAGRYWDSSETGPVRVSSSVAKLAWGSSERQSMASAKVVRILKTFPS